MNTVSASYNDGKTARAQPARVSLEGGLLIARNEEGSVLAAWNPNAVAVDGRKKDVLRVRPEPDTGERLTIQGRENVSPVLEWAAPALHRAAVMRRRRWLLGAVAVWLAVFAVWQVSPLLLDGITAMVPYSWEKRLGEQTRDSVGRVLSRTPTGPIPWKNGGPGYDALVSLVARLAEAGGDDGSRYGISILNSPVVNAFALPGGYIIVTTGLIRRCGSADELAGVLAHEMAHVSERHNTRRLVRDELFAFAGKVLSGGSGAMDTVQAVGNKVISSTFSREDERAADILGTRRLAKAGINPGAAALFFERLPKDEGRLGYLSSHPETAERQEYMRREAAAFPGPFSAALPAAQWRELRNLAN